MMVSWSPAAVAAFVLTVFLGSFSLTSAYDWDVVTDLDTYVQSDDGHFAWSVLTSYDYDGVTLHIVNMTSQQYQDATFVDHPIWWHIVGIAVPTQIDYPDFGILWISTVLPDDDDTVPPADDLRNSLVSQLANDSKTVSGYITRVLNQPLIFADDPTQTPRVENEIIAWTWRSYLNNPTPDNTVLARMPMTKAAKRGLDTLYEFTQANVPGTDLQRFAVAGASEGGWTTWSLAATDQRVEVIAPLVFSTLNAGPTLMNHFQSMDGAWSFAFQPFYKENLTQDFFNPKAEGIYDVEDAYRYRERLTIPIFTILASGDEFFLTDENRFWWDGIPATDKYQYTIANAEHYLFPHYTEVYQTLVSALLTYLLELPYPQVSWEINPTATGGEILFHTNPAPLEVFAYRAVTLGNDTRRDFRLASGTPPDLVRHPVRWRQDIEIEDQGDGNYRIAVDEVPGEWTGFFIQGSWAGPIGGRMSATSQVGVVPDTLPHEACTDAATCYGTLV
jgi:PhoPQ-activated pathogenicity-related protein